jgi:hypothetical protein
MDYDFVRSIGDSFVKSMITLVVGAVIFSCIVTGIVVYSITKHANDPKQIEYRETVESLTPEQREILGL